MTTIKNYNVFGVPVPRRFAKKLRLEREVSWVMCGKPHNDTSLSYVACTMLHKTVGESATVKIDGAWTIDRFLTEQDVVGFYHTHPWGSKANYSKQDAATMNAWVQALGKSLICAIDDGIKVKAWIFYTDGGIRRIRITSTRRRRISFVYPRKRWL